MYGGQTNEDPYTRRGRGRGEMYEKNENLGIQQLTWEYDELTVNIISNGKTNIRTPKLGADLSRSFISFNRSNRKAFQCTKNYLGPSLVRGKVSDPVEACAVMGIDTQSITRDNKNLSQCNGTPAHQGCFRQPGRSYEIVSSRHTVLGCDSEKRAIVPGSRSEFSRVVEWLESAHTQIPNPKSQIRSARVLMGRISLAGTQRF